MTFQAFEDHTQWKAVKEVCRTLKEAGHQALLAGGCVRDLIMNREPNDFDVATDATPDQVEALFPRALTVGKAFGVTILPFDGFQIEVATFREDLEYKDGRRPEGVKFSTAKADAQRRDFTVNALFFDPETNAVIDYVEGQKDIAGKVLRTVGEPARRFEEDKLRILRAIRFAAQLDFQIAPDTLKVVTELASEVSVVSRERIRDELFKLLKSPRRDVGLSLLLSTGVLESAFPEAAPAIRADGGKWLARFKEGAAIESTEPSSDLFPAQELDFVFWLSLFFFPAYRASVQAHASDPAKSEKEFRDQCLKSLKLETQLADQIVFALKHLEIALKPSTMRLGSLALLLTKPAGASLLKVAQVLENTGELPSESNRAKLIQKAISCARTESGEAVPAYLSGQDLKNLGFKPGPSMGETLNEAYLLQLEGTLRSKDEALAWAAQRK